MSLYRQPLLLIVLLATVQLTQAKPRICNSTAIEWIPQAEGHKWNETGSVSLVAVVNASAAFTFEQITRLGVMIELLRSAGLDDVTFVTLNVNESMDQFAQLQQSAAQVGIKAYQESVRSSERRANVNDMFIYDR
jgi:hypothetical protein